MHMRFLPLISLLPLLFAHALFSAASAATVEAPESGFTLVVPDDWKSTREGDPGAYSYTFMTPDEQLAVGVSAIRIQPTIPLEDVVPLFEKNAFAGAETIDDEYGDFNGISGLLKSYTWEHNGQQLGVSAFYAITQGHFYTIWTLAELEQFSALAGLADNVSKSFRLVPVREASPAAADAPAVRLERFETGTSLAGEHRVAQPQTSFAPDTPEIHAAFRTEGSLRGIPLILEFTYTTENLKVFTNELLPGEWQEYDTTEGHMTYSKPDEGWPPGDYRVDMLHDGRLLGSAGFNVK